MKHFKEAIDELLNGISGAMKGLDFIQVERMLKNLIKVRSEGKKVLVVGAGRSGLVGKAFALRLMHLGFNVHVMGETLTPSFGVGDLVLIISGSGSTTLPITIAQRAKKLGSGVLCITSRSESPLGKITDRLVEIPGREVIAREDDYTSRQLIGVHESLTPLGTLFEDSSMVFLDSIIAELMMRLEISEETMKKKHATIE